MKHTIIPITPEDFSTLEKTIGINEDKFCPYCNSPLISNGEGMFAPGIFYSCAHCGRRYKRTNYIDMAKKESYFQLKEIIEGAYR